MSFGLIQEDQILYGKYTERFRDHYRTAASIPWQNAAMRIGPPLSPAVHCIQGFFHRVRALNLEPTSARYDFYPCTTQGLEQLRRVSADFWEDEWNHSMNQWNQGWKEGFAEEYWRPPIWCGDMGMKEGLKYRTYSASVFDCHYPPRVLSEIDPCGNTYFLAAAVERLFNYAVRFTIKSDCGISDNPYSWLLKSAEQGVVFVAFRKGRAVFAILKQ